MKIYIQDYKHVEEANAILDNAAIIFSKDEADDAMELTGNARWMLNEVVAHFTETVEPEETEETQLNGVLDMVDHCILSGKTCYSKSCKAPHHPEWTVELTVSRTANRNKSNVVYSPYNQSHIEVGQGSAKVVEAEKLLGEATTKFAQGDMDKGNSLVKDAQWLLYEFFHSEPTIKVDNISSIQGMIEFCVECGGDSTTLSFDLGKRPGWNMIMTVKR